VLSLTLLRDEKKFRHLDKNIEHRYKAAAAAVAGSLGFSASVHLCGRKIVGHEQNSMDCKGRKKLGRKGKEERHRGKEINQERWRNSAGFQPSKTCFRQTETGKKQKYQYTAGHQELHKTTTATHLNIFSHSSRCVKIVHKLK